MKFIPEYNELEAIRLYKSGRSIRWIADYYYSSYSTIHNHLKGKVEFRPRGGNNSGKSGYHYSKQTRAN